VRPETIWTFLKPVAQWLWKTYGAAAVAALLIVIEEIFRNIFGKDPRGGELKDLVDLWVSGDMIDEQFVSQAEKVLSKEPPIPIKKKVALVKEMKKLRTKGLLTQEQCKLIVDLLLQ